MAPESGASSLARGRFRLVTVCVLAAIVGAGSGCQLVKPIGQLFKPILKPFSVDPGNPRFDLPPVPVIVFYVDGLRKDIFEEMAQNGELPLLKRYILDRAASVENAIGTIPSLTYPNATTIVTGVDAGRHGIVANAWFDRDRLVARNYESSSTMGKANTDIKVPTIYEILDDRFTAVIGMQVNKGAKITMVTGFDDGGLPAGVAWTTGQMEEVDAIMAENMSKLGNEVRCHGHWPDFALIYFPGPDDVAHSKGPESCQYRTVLRSLDKSLGAILCAFDRGGMLDRFTLVLVADHGQHQVCKQNFVDVASFVQQSLGVPVYGRNDDVDETVSWFEIDEAFDFRGRERMFSSWQAVVTHSGERQASLHLRSGRNWSERPTLDQILTFHHERAVFGTCYAGEPLPAVLLSHPAIAFAAVRDGADAVQLYGRTGVGRIERDRATATPSYRYQTVSGADPLFADDPAPSPLADGQFHGSREWLQATAALSHPDVVPQMVELFDSARAGDVMLFASPSWDFSKKYLGGHGGLERQDLHIPFYFVGPEITPGQRLHAARSVDLLPTVLDLMGLGDRAVGLDGVSLAPELRAAAAETAPSR